MRRAAAGDQVAFRSLVVQYQNVVFGVAFTVLGDVHDAEDAAQEAFLRLHRSLSRYRGDAALGTWVFRLSLTAALDRRRWLARRRASSAAELPPTTVDAGVPPEVHAEARALLKAMARLAPALRAPLVLREVYGYPYAEIAAQLGTPVGTVKAAVHRGRAALLEELRGRMTPEGEDE